MATPSSDGPDHAHADVNGADHVGGAGRPPHDGEGGDGGDAGGPARGDVAEGGSAKGAVKRTLREFKEDNLTDWAAALTYYGVLAIFPALLALVSILGLLGPATIDSLIKNLSNVAPGSMRDMLTTVLEQLKGGQGKALLALIIGVVLALWSASGYVAAFMRASNIVYDIGEGRPVWKTLPVRFGITVAVVVLLALTAVGVVFTGPLAKKMGSFLGLGDTAVTAWNIAKWPVMFILVVLIIMLLYWAAPNVKRQVRRVVPGGVLAVVIWLIASALFALYVANFSSYNKTYGAFATPIVALIWLWLTNIAILLGLEFNAELERGRAIDNGHPPGDEPYAEPRDTRKL
ncbi:MULTISPECIES: YihY/virulence factor BrkB family protein [unclassified Streptomyces]|uniref:YihY/virulence factor BrkB family protein n=1 Tax=unclassified Streptomyces TaxID=2593676 RepID=UPI002E7FDA3B|nr:YihY/virulence factor BrkB family protein [Streptomyces sp. NBC_00562]WTC76954.1 YihY/virulence factor BrkB family protein [Streptomyces sp. NBC_01653]WTD93905.1 YihY/virulence factor BrkB family protein [Streptomyces sp. NBC_01637]WUC24928.1 YihY/virulence factor BrkB family protein [Streptomyces sp. NBC_00562]